MKHIISVLVENKFGVLARVAGLFSARGYNISSLAVSETQDPTISHMTIVVKAEDEDSRPLTIEAEDLLACVFQHEIDHLYGKLIVDYASLLDKLKIKKKLKELKKRSKHERLPDSETKSCKLQL